MKKRWLWTVVIVLLAAAVLLLADTKSSAVHHVLRHQQQVTAYAERCLQHQAETARYEAWDTSCEDGVVLFEVSYVGFGPQSDQKGFYYSPDDAVVGLGNELGTEIVDEGVKFLGEGDNYTYVEKIADHWYWFERHW